MKNLKNLTIGSYIFCASKFSFKTLFTKPLRLVIQIFTGGREEHVAQIIAKNLIADSTGEGVRIRTIQDWLEHHVSGYEMELYAYQFLKPLTKGQQKKLTDFWKRSVGEKYNALLASYSALDDLPFFRKIKVKNAEGSFCSMKCAQSLEIIIGKEFLPEKKINTKELAHLLTSTNLTSGKEKCLF